MRVIFLRSAESGLPWFSRYYRRVLGCCRSLLEANPRVGSGFGGLRKLVVRKTPFLLIYRIAEDRVEILEVSDGRAGRVGRDALSDREELE